MSMILLCVFGLSVKNPSVTKQLEVNMSKAQLIEYFQEDNSKHVKRLCKQAYGEAPSLAYFQWEEKDDKASLAMFETVKNLE